MLRRSALRRSALTLGKLCAIGAVALTLGMTVTAQVGPSPFGTRPDDADARLRTLQRQSEQLQREGQSLVGELRRLEIERERRLRDARDADAALAKARETLDAANARLEAIEQARSAALPDLHAQLVDLYKRGRGRHAQLLLRAGSPREFARARRAVAALLTITQQRVAEHERLLAALQAEQAAQEQAALAVAQREREAQQARRAAGRALEAQESLAARIESQHDLQTQYVEELLVAYGRLHEAVSAGASAPAGVRPLVGGVTPAPAGLVQGRLRWPASGPVTGQYGEAAGRLGGSAVRNGIEVAAPEGTPVRAAAAGLVSFAGPYTGFGTLIVLSHGDRDYSLYGYLGGVQVTAGDRVPAGTEIGTVGRAPAGPPALYFELRIDGRSVDPVQWLESR